MNNAWILCRYHGLALDNLTFRKQVVQAMLQKYGTAAKRVGYAKDTATKPLRQDHGGHLLTSTRARRRCAVCHSKTVKAGQRCLVNLHDKCLERFHRV